MYEEKEKLEDLIKRCEEELKGCPKGTLRIAHRRNKTQYYWRSESKEKLGKYIKDSEKFLAEQLAQKDYAKKLLKLAKEKWYLLETCINGCDMEELEIFHKQFSQDRQELITPFFLSEEEYIAQWEERLQDKKLEKGKLLIESERTIETDRGELVRSKSEKILADKLYAMQIPYLYEIPLLLTGFGYVHPDFTVLNKRTKETFYWEHFGMMDNSEYVEKSIKKIESYQKNHIYPGKQLILTYETYTHAVSSKIIEGLITTHLQ